MTIGDRNIYAWIEPPEDNRQYQAYSLQEDIARSSRHYELDAEFFYLVTGGEWNVYSCSLWEDGFSLTQAQEKKLDTLAHLLGLEPGMHLLDVGCGWGGPVTYLCRRYGVIGHGIAITPIQIAEANARAARYGVNASFEVRHWLELEGVEEYDAIMSDEAMVHFHDLNGFFATCRRLLRRGACMAHKELHLTREAYAELGAVGRHINKTFGYTANYGTLHRELKLLDENGFELKNLVEIPLEQYGKTMDVWLSNMFENRERLQALAGDEVYRAYRAYVRGYRLLFNTGHLRLDVVASRKVD